MRYVKKLMLVPYNEEQLNCINNKPSSNLKLLKNNKINKSERLSIINKRNKKNIPVSEPSTTSESLVHNIPAQSIDQSTTSQSSKSITSAPISVANSEIAQSQTITQNVPSVEETETQTDLSASQYDKADFRKNIKVQSF